MSENDKNQAYHEQVGAKMAKAEIGPIFLEIAATLNSIIEDLQQAVDDIDKERKRLEGQE